jgi:hypothetical protein
MVHQTVERRGLNVTSCDAPHENRLSPQIALCYVVAFLAIASLAITQDVQK